MMEIGRDQRAVHVMSSSIEGIVGGGGGKVSGVIESDR